jgi:hypothetical protein
MAKDDEDKCLGYSSFNGESTEYDCDHEFACSTSCEDCIYGPCGGKVDPRIDPDLEEEE